MRKGKTYLVAGLLAVAFIALVRLLSNNNQLAWDHNYLPDSKMPYGTWVFHQLVQQNKRNLPVTIVKKNLPEQLQGKQNAVYVRIAPNDHFRANDIAALKDFVHAGNTAFFATEQLPPLLLMHFFLPAAEADSIDYWLQADFFNQLPDSVYDSWDGQTDVNEIIEDFKSQLRTDLQMRFGTTNSVNDTSVEVKLWNQQPVVLTNASAFGTDKSLWGYFAQEQLQTDMVAATPLGYLNHVFVDYISLKFGAGTVYFHLTPQLFTNYHMRNPPVFEMAQNMVKSWGNHNIILLDHTDRRHQFSRNGNKLAPSPLAYILGNRSLRWAWYLLLLVTVAYIVSQVRRTQREIAVLPILPNTSIEYAKALGTLAMRHPNHPDAAQHAFRIFKNHAWEKLRLPDQENLKLYEQSLLRARPEQKQAIKRAIALLYISEKHPENFVGANLIALYNLLTQIQKTF